MTVTKTVNYTPEMEARLKEVYVPTATQDERTAQVKALSVELKRTTRSIIAKLTTLSLYVPKVYKTKQGGKVVKKEQIVSAIEAIAGKELNGLEKATKAALITIFNLVAEPAEAAFEENESEVSEV
jgi:hypothetical protein